MVEVGQFKVYPGEVVFKEVVGPNGKFTFEAGLVKVDHGPTEGIASYYQVYGRNLGDIGQLSKPDHAAHFKGIYVVYENVRSDDVPHTIYGRNNQIPAIVKTDWYSYGLRDGWLQEPTASIVINKTLVFSVLDFRGPFEPYPEQWSTNIADPLSVNFHRWKGGFMKLWDLIVTEPGFEKLIEEDPQPKNVPLEWYELTKTDFAPLYPIYVKRLYDSIDYAPINQNTGNIEYANGQHGLLWWMFQGEARWKYWGTNKNPFVIDSRSHAVGWKHWLDLQWAEGHYNNPYNWPLIVFRRWEKTRSPVAWSMLTRLVKWNSTSGIVWSSDMVNGQRIPRWRGGYSWYEKGQRGYEVGSNYWPMEYKQYSESILLSSLLYPKQSWSKEAINWHGRALITDMKYDTWNAQYGERIPAWGIINSMAYAKYTQDRKYREYAKRIIDHCINLMKTQSRINAEFDPKWKDATLGVPYIYDTNVVSSNSPEGAYWQTAKLLIGLVTYAYETKSKEYDAKIEQMTKFLVEEGLIQVGPYYVGRYRFTKDRIPAQYLNGNKGGLFNTINAQTTEWWLIPVGYCAKILDKEWAKPIFTQLHKQSGIFTDWPIDVIYTYFPSISDVEIDESKVVKLDTAGLIPGRHKVRLVNSQDEVSFTDFEVLSATEIRLNVADPEVYKSLIFTGPWLTYVKSTADKAIKSMTFDFTKRVPVATSKFDWSNGLHHNAWPKIVEQALSQTDWPHKWAK